MEEERKKGGQKNRKKGGRGRDNREDKNREAQIGEETMKKCCKICFNRYNDTQRRPRVLPCGHSYCSLCISNHLVGNKLVCPTCRREHCADNSTEFPINYELEQDSCTNTNSPDVDSQRVSSPSEEPQSISRLLVSSREEHCKEMENIETKVREKRSNLDGYESQMTSWKEEHLREMELHLSCAQEHREVITSIDKENQTVKDASGEADNILQEVRTSVNDLNAANTNKKLLSSMENSGSVYDKAHEWNSDVQETYPNSELIKRSHKLRQKSKNLLRKWRQTDQEASLAEDQHHLDIAASSGDEISACGGQRDMEVEFTNIQEKIKCLLDNLESFQKDQITQTEARIESLQKETFTQTEEMSFSIISDLKSLTPSARSLIESNLLFCEQIRRSEIRYARITIDRQRDICIHTLRKDVELPPNAIVLQQGDVVGADGRRPGLTFLDLAAEGRPLGRLRIRLDPQRGNYPLNFHLLCTGEEGPSYAQSGVFGVGGRGYDLEFVCFGDYERNNGGGGRGVVPGVDWGEEWRKMKEINKGKKWEEGSVGVGWRGEEEKASQFGVSTKDNKKRTMPNFLGKLDDKESLDVLKEALDRYCPKRYNGYYTDDNLKKIVIADCGVILPRH